jgi:two-component system, sensor histidine kinase
MLYNESDLDYSLKQTLKISIGWSCILILISFISFQMRNFSDSLLLYLPTAFSITLVHWYGYRILPIIYLNAIITLFMWGAKGDLIRILILATHEPLVALISKALVSRFQHKKFNQYFKSTNQFVLFTALGIIVPIFFNTLYTYNYSFINGDLEKVSLLLLSDFITIFCLSIPFLYFFTPNRSGWISLLRPITFKDRGVNAQNEFWLVVVVSVGLSFFVPFGKYWFIYGIVTVIIGVRQGFDSVLLLNSILFLTNYILPLLQKSTGSISSSASTQLINVHLGNATMLFTSTLVGRVISELRKTEQTLTHQKLEIETTNKQLNQTNLELDRFVYSVSHDLSAPLKSIQGLIHLSRIETKDEKSLPYLDMMERSATRLDDFINEVLDYARTSRKEIKIQEVQLDEVVNELRDKFIFHDKKNLQFQSSLQSTLLHTDPILLKIALGNLLSNALKFQKSYSDHIPTIEIKSREDFGEIKIEVVDNGEGIQQDHLEKIFNMFYRATSNSPGSGLGLYIAREAVNKLGGKISVRTKYGEGSVFTISLPVN